MGSTLEDVSKATGFSVGYLSKLERSDKIPPYSTMQVLSSVLRVSVNDLLEGYDITQDSTNSEREDDIVIVRSQLNYDDNDTGEPLFEQNDLNEHGYSLIPLTHNYRNRYISPFLTCIPPRGTTAVYNHDAEEFNFVIKGPITFNYSGKKYFLNTGDSFYFDSRKDHSVTNENDFTAILITTIYSYRRF